MLIIGGRTESHREIGSQDVVEAIQQVGEANGVASCLVVVVIVGDPPLLEALRHGRQEARYHMPRELRTRRDSGTRSCRREPRVAHRVLDHDVAG